MSFFGRIGGSMPYVKWNELNEDWILAETKKALEDWARYHAEWDEWKGDLDNAFEDLVQYVNNYFANLDLEDEVSDKINQMIADGTFNEIISPMVPGIITGWLEENITPTTPPVDKSLTVNDAAANAQTVGNYIFPIVKEGYNILNVTWENANITNGEIAPMTTGVNNFAAERYFELPEGETKIRLTGEVNAGNSTIYIQSYDVNKEFISYQSKKVNDFPVVAQLPEGTKYIRINGYLAGGRPYQTVVPNKFMITYGNVARPYIPPVIINESAAFFQNKYVRYIPELYHTHSTRQEYSEVYGATAIYKKIKITFDKIVAISPNDLSIAFQIYENEFDQPSDRIYDSGWLGRPGVVDVSEYKNCYLRIVEKNYSGGVFDIEESSPKIEIYFINDNEYIDDESERNKNILSLANNKSIAHRGLSKIAPDNLNISYKIAKLAGFNYGENDLNISKDNQFVMWHDPTLNKLGNVKDINGYDVFMYDNQLVYFDAATNKFYKWENDEYIEITIEGEAVRVVGSEYSTADFTLAELKRFDFGRYKGGEYQGETINTLEEFIKYMHRSDMGIYLDRKITYTSENLAEVVDMLDRYGMQPKTYFVGGFTPTTINQLKEAAPYIKGFVSLAKPTQSNIDNFAQYGADEKYIIFNPDGKTITDADIATIKNAAKQGYITESYYVDYSQNKAQLMQILNKIINSGISAITTDNYNYSDITKE